ncbi:MAG: DUF924 family protein [Pseudomonadota bacterium]
MSDLPTADDVLAFWFEELEPKQHFVKDEALDATIKARFFDLHRALMDGSVPDFTATARGKFAAIIVLDQFSRNMFRGEDAAFASDARALDLAKSLVWSGDDMGFTDDERVFLYMPYMHAENLNDQDDCVRLFEVLGRPDNIDYALQHRDVIRRFGRFPQRNDALDRPSTPEEIDFITTPGTGF